MDRRREEDIVATDLRALRSPHLPYPSSPRGRGGGKEEASFSPLSPRERGAGGVRASEGIPPRNSQSFWKRRAGWGLVLFALAAPLAAAEPRPLKVDDVFSLKTVGDPRVSPDGQWVAYTVRTLDAKEDAANTDVYMAPFTGGPAVQLTASPKPETRPRFSPDGRYLAFLSGRDGKKTQVWLLDRRGGEAVKLTDYKADVSELAWSPDGKRLALIVGDVDPDDQDDEKAAGEKTGAAKTPKPIVIRRLQFLRDGEGFLRDLHQHLYVFDVAAKSGEQITSGPYDDTEPTWSPDGRQL